MPAKQSKPDEPSDTLSLKDLEATLSKLEAEKSRRAAEKQAQGKMIVLKVTTFNGESATEQKRNVYAEHLRQHPEDAGKQVEWLEHVIITGVPRSRNWGRGTG